VRDARSWFLLKLHLSQHGQDPVQFSFSCLSIERAPIRNATAI